MAKEVVVDSVTNCFDFILTSERFDYAVSDSLRFLGAICIDRFDYDCVSDS